ncbi:hypothetical protein ACK3TF_004079 [Chlorella vulgaris]
MTRVWARKRNCMIGAQFNPTGTANSDELRGEIRRQFELQRPQKDQHTVRFLLSDGRLKLKQLGEMLGMQQ